MKISLHSFALRIFLVALVLRLIPVLAASDLGIGLDDMFQYDMLARSVVAGQGYRWYSEEDLALIERYFPLDFVKGDYDPRGVLTSYRAPGYPGFLSLVYLVNGVGEDRFFAVRLVQAFIGALLPLLAYALGRRMFPGREKIARVAAITIAIYPMLLVYPLALATENIFIPLVLGGVLALLRAGETRRKRDYLLAGTLFGLAALTRSVISAILPFALLWTWFLARDRKGAVILLACVLAVTLPWSIRNTQLHGDFVFVESGLGYNLHMGYHPETDGTFKYGPSLELMPYLDDRVRDTLGREMWWQFVQDDPLRVPYLMVRKLAHFFALERRGLAYFYSNNIFGHIPAPYLALLFLLFLSPFVIVATSSAVALPFVAWSRETVLVGLVSLGYLAPHLLLLAEPRFHLTLVPVLSVFAARAWTMRRADYAAMLGGRNTWRPMLAAVLVAGLWFNWGHELWRDSARLHALFGPEGNETYFDY